MRQLSCASMGDSSCNFVAKGENDEEVVAKMQEHVKTAHPDKAAEGADAEAMKEKMMAAITDVA